MGAENHNMSAHQHVDVEKQNRTPDDTIHSIRDSAAHKGDYHPQRRRSRIWISFGLLLLYFFLLRECKSRLDLAQFDLRGSPSMGAATECCRAATIPYNESGGPYKFDNIDWNLSTSAFKFQQKFSAVRPGMPSPQRIQTIGKVIVQQGTDPLHPVTVTLDVKISRQELAEVIEITQEGGALTVETPQFWSGHGSPVPCISIVATILVSSTVDLSTFEISTVVLPVDLHKSLELQSSAISIRTICGKINSATGDLNGRRIEIETTSASITGSYPLRDLLSLRSISGIIDVRVDPQSDGHEQSSSNFLAQTRSGTIHIDTLTSNIPDRKYISQVHSVSGTLTGSYLLGIESSMSTTSGSIDVDLYQAGEVPSQTLIVKTVSGTVQSRLHEPNNSIDSAISARFDTVSGSVGAFFPSSCKGNILAKSTAGSVEVTGRDVKIIKDGRPFPGAGREITAVHGEGQSDIVAATVSGPINIRFP